MIEIITGATATVTIVVRDSSDLPFKENIHFQIQDLTGL